MNQGTQTHSTSIGSKGKHITFSERQLIERWVREKKSIAQIASSSPVIASPSTANLNVVVSNISIPSLENTLPIPAAPLDAVATKMPIALSAASPLKALTFLVSPRKRFPRCFLDESLPTRHL